MVFKSSATAACAKQAVAQINVTNVQVFLTSTAINPNPRVFKTEIPLAWLVFGSPNLTSRRART